MRVRIVIIAVAISILFFSAEVYVKANESAEQCIAAIKKIKSYDVVIRLDTLVASTIGQVQKGEGEVPATSIWHDVFAIGLGRRIEQDWKDPANQHISVKSWDTVRSSGELPASAFERLGPADYFSYNNPIFAIVSAKPPFRFMFLEELLTDISTTVEDIDASKALTIGAMPLLKDVRGVRIDSSRLGGPVHVWLDPNSGFMPCRIEEFTRSMSPDTVMQIDRFKKVGPDVWVPLAAKSADVRVDGDDTHSRAFGPNDKVELTGTIDAITVDESASS